MLSGRSDICRSDFQDKYAELKKEDCWNQIKKTVAKSFGQNRTRKWKSTVIYKSQENKTKSFMVDEQNLIILNEIFVV